VTWTDFWISSKRLTVSLVDTFIADLRDSVEEAKLRPSGKGTMVSIYGGSNMSSARSRPASYNFFQA
jgi:hypothetical protein